MQSKLIISNSEILKRIFILYLYNDPLYLAHITLKGPGIFTVFHVGADLKLQIGM